MTDRHLYRSCTNRFLGGVCGGLGEYFDIDPIILRLIFVLLAFAGIGVITYLIAWIVIPTDPKCAGTKSASDEIKEKANSVADEIKKATRTGNYKMHDGRLIVGLILVILGIVAFANIIFSINLWQIVWPAILVIVGLIFLARAKK